MFVKHLKSLIFLCHILKKFMVLSINMREIENLKNNHFQMKGNKYCEMSICIKFISNVYLDD